MDLTTSKQETDHKSPEPNYYQILDIYPGASRVSVREAYLRLKSAYGTGSAALYSLISEDTAQKSMNEIEVAFRILNDEFSRRKYDADMGFEPLDSSQEATAGFGTGFTRKVGIRPRDPKPEAPRVIVRGSLEKPIQLKAHGAGTEELEEKFAELIGRSDPGDGDLYQKLRLAAGVCEKEMQERTKICVDYLDAIENNRFDRLPQPVYVKGFLRSYMKYLGVPKPEMLITAYAARLEDWHKTKA
jgi:hypothetical protein